jgi:phospholipid/cholesterol/gamma-HCH transport system substrate-binding protein
MRTSRADTLKVGLFVAVAGALLAGSLLWLTGAHLFRSVHTYSVLFRRSVSGLNAGANVEYQGVVVGRVRDIRLTGDLPPRVAVVVDLDADTPVRSDTTAALVGSLVTGIKFIQLQGGSAAAPALSPGQTIEGSVPSLEVFGERLGEIMDRVSDLLRGLQEDVFTAENRTRLNGVLASLASVAARLDNAMEVFRAKETTTEIAELVRTLSAAAENANVILADFRARRETIYGGLERMAGTGDSLEALVADLTAATLGLQETLDVIQSDPSTLLWGRSLPARERER